MDEKEVVDISQFSFEEFITFLFDREIPARTTIKEWNPWYWHTSVLFDAQRICGYYTKLFSAPGFLIERFSKAQLEEGFWAISSGNHLECSVYELIWNTDSPFADRKECVKSMFYLYRDMFAAEPLDTASFMWWDLLCKDLWQWGNRDRLSGGEDLTMQDVMFETLVSILALDSEHCQKAALHGLGHLNHPDTEEAIRIYLAKHDSLGDDQREYVLSAARFAVL
jgi:hypothetical protein